jgi:hypothetical protein
MILSGFSPVKANWWITFGMGADTKKKDNKKSQGGGICFLFLNFVFEIQCQAGQKCTCANTCANVHLPSAMPLAV